jgi:8-oxo-dGTP pyrophosphatase MutT (NUDIX family)
MKADIIQSATIHQGRTFKLVSETVALANKVTSTMEFIRHPGAAAIVPFFGEDTILLVKQYRHAVGHFIWEIPAGTREESESPLQCAQREIVEETGFSAGTWKELGSITPVPSYSDERIHIFRATDLKPAKQDLDADEILNVAAVRLDQVIKMISEGKIYDSKTLAAFFLAGLRLPFK